MACKVSVALNTDIRSVVFLFFSLLYFISRLVFHSLQNRIRMQLTNLNFFSARKFRQPLDSEGEVVTFRP